MYKKNHPEIKDLISELEKIKSGIEVVYQLESLHLEKLEQSSPYSQTTTNLEDNVYSLESAIDSISEAIDSLNETMEEE